MDCKIEIPENIYTDGSCMNFKGKFVGAGSGVYFGEDHPLNKAVPNKKPFTNNRAELMALQVALQLIEKETKVIYVHSDSKYSINSTTVWAKKWKRNGWKKTGGEIKNLDLIKWVHFFMLNHNNVIFKHVKAHTTKQDIHSIGNRAVDLLARDACIESMGDGVYEQMQAHKRKLKDDRKERRKKRKVEKPVSEKEIKEIIDRTPKSKGDWRQCGNCKIKTQNATVCKGCKRHHCPKCISVRTIKTVDEGEKEIWENTETILASVRKICSKCFRKKFKSINGFITKIYS